jgi:hypothetical protein
MPGMQVPGIFLHLLTNCRTGKMSAFIKNWKTAKSNVKLARYIKCRFYDDNLKQNKQVVLNAWFLSAGRQVYV